MSGNRESSTSIRGPQIEEFARRYESELSPLRGQFMSQLLSGLQTGGVGTSLPILNQAQTQAQDALSRTMRSLKSRGGTDDPVIQRLLKQVGLEGESYNANIGPEFVQNFLKMAAGTGKQSLGDILSSLGGVGYGRTSGWNFGIASKYFGGGSQDAPTSDSGYAGGEGGMTGQDGTTELGTIYG